MSLLDTASLLLTPNAYKEGKLYSVIPSDGSGDFTATRATTATRVNADGLVDLVPYNLLQRSEEFGTAPWSLINGASIAADTTTAPNGTLTADTLTFNGTPFGQIQQASTRTTGDVLTLSIWMKSNTLTTIALYIGNDTSNVTINSSWQRFTITKTITSNAATPKIVSSIAGSVDIWGAQLVEGTSARDYLRTETRLNIPRIDYSLGGCPNILLEPQRTNLARQSSSFDNASWTKTASSVTANTTTSPSGIQDADTLTADGTSSRHDAFFAPSVTSGTTYTYSIYAKKGTNDFFQISTGGGFGSNAFANFDLNSGVLGTIGSAATATITALENGWYRCTMTAPATVTGTTGIYNLIVTSASTSRLEVNTLSTSVFLWGAQFEQGAYSTSYIPTTTASVTRNADTITRNNIYTNGLITAAGGTWFVEVRDNIPRTRDAFAQSLFIGALSTGAGSDGFAFTQAAGSSRLIIRKYIGAVETVVWTFTVDNSKIAIKWNGTTADIFQNGTKVVSATAFSGTNMQWLVANGTDVPKNINQMALFPTPLTDDQLIELTTI